MVDYKALLNNPKVRLALGRRRFAKAVEDDDFLTNLISDQSKNVLTLSWDGTTAGANWITEWQGFYFFSSSDYDPEGPFDSLEEVTGDERFWVETANPELDSEVVSLEKLMKMGKALAGQEGHAVFINGKKFVLSNDCLIEEKEEG